MKQLKIAVVGAGKMGGAIIRMLASSGKIPVENIIACVAPPDDPVEVSERLGIKVILDSASVVKDRDVVLVAVKPHQSKTVLENIRGILKPDQLVISVITGRTTGYIEDILGRENPVIRVVPNTPFQIKAGMTVIFPGRFASDVHLKMAEEIFQLGGLVETVHDESLMDIATALVGSGPAFLYLVMESLAEGAIYSGMPSQLASRLSAQVTIGAGRMMLESGRHPAMLRGEVATPGGTTVEGLAELEKNGVRAAFMSAVEKAAKKAKMLSK